MLTSVQEPSSLVLLLVLTGTSRVLKCSEGGSGPTRSCDLGLDGQVQPAATLMAVGFGSLPYHNLTAQTLQLAPVPVDLT